MPTYEYRCDTCDTTFDVVQSFHDDPLSECPTCGSPVRKVFGSVGIVFKGSGFYKTDSRSGSGRSTGGGSPASGAPSAASPAPSAAPAPDASSSASAGSPAPSSPSSASTTTTPAAP